MGSWAASCQVMAQGSGLPDIQVKDLWAFCLSRGTSGNFWRECVNEKKKNQWSEAILQERLLGFILEFIHMWEPALQTGSRESEWFITKGRPLLLSSMLLKCFCLMLVGYLLSMNSELLLPVGIALWLLQVPLAFCWGFECSSGTAHLCPPVKGHLMQQLVSPGIPEQVSNRCGNSKCHQWKWLSCLNEGWEMWDCFGKLWGEHQQMFLGRRWGV